MVDIMSSPNEFPKASEEFEDGELPEDGEIQDEEETNSMIKYIKRKKRIIAPSAVSVKENHRHTVAAEPSPPIKKFAHRGYGDDIVRKF